MFVLNKKLFILLGIIVVLGIVAFDFYFKSDSILTSQLSQNTNSNTVVDSKDNFTIEPSPFIGKPVSEIPKYTGRPLDEVVFGKGFTDPGGNFIENKRKDLKVLAAVLNSNPVGAGGVDDWIAVGIIKKSFNDYEGARDAWEYAGVLYPNNALSFANLGNLYGFYLHDNIKAELNYKKAILNDPYQADYYLGLADFYKNVFTDKKSEVPSILLEGMSTIKDVNLVLSLATYYRDIGDKVNAIKYYEEVLKISPDQMGIQDEINRLK